MSDSPSPECPFCDRGASELLYADQHVVAFLDAYPVSRGHALVVPRRHVADWFSATEAEQQALTSAIKHVRRCLDEQFIPDGYNIGVNVGAAAGQTVFHLHLHVIPRYLGDVPNPRGGVRHIIPGKGDYTASLRPTDDGAPHARALIAGGTGDPLLPHLVAHLEYAVELDIAVAFVQPSGLDLIETHVQTVLDRGGRVRIVAGNYLQITHPDALQRLLDLSGDVHLRIFESGELSFHPKAYIIRSPSGGAAIVGSSNLSRSALEQGVEWNYRVIMARNVEGFQAVREGFERLLTHERVRPLDQAWVDGYRRRWVPRPELLPDATVELPAPAPEPHPIQVRALEALAQVRSDGGTAGLVVLATGLGKTWLSAFDSNRPEFRRILFIAHRDEILAQAMRTYRRLRPDARLGRYDGSSRDTEADVLFASIQTLGRQRHLEQFPADHFDYVVVDEFHHATAPTYQRLLDHFSPKFLLGLTATPERMDGGRLLALCGETLAFRCDVPEGIQRGLLSPFAYYGVPDVIDYDNIPWRNRRFDEATLTAAAATRERADNALDQYRRRGGKRTIAFCVSQAHADFMADHFRVADIPCAAVHSGPTSAPRARSLDRLESGELKVLFAVDMFNEGLDIPSVDTVLMLRPTESPVIWLQQFGRGLRHQPGKVLKVIDYIGNHRSFLVKPQTLLQLEPGDREIAAALKRLEAGELELPPGCSVTYELEAKDIIRALLRERGGDRLRTFYENHREMYGARPTALECSHGGYEPHAARDSHGSWFALVKDMGDLSGVEAHVLEQHGELLRSLETTPMVRSYKMLVLLAMIMEGSFPGTIPIDQLAARVVDLAHRHSLTRTELGEALTNADELRSLLEQNPLAAWTGGRGTGGVAYFRYDGGSFSTAFAVAPELVKGLTGMVRELAEWRLGLYLRRLGHGASANRFVCKVFHADGRPILKLPPRDQIPNIPEGWVEIRADGATYKANFVRIAVNLIRKEGDPANQLNRLLREWFGPDAGLPGTSFQVEFRHVGNAYVMSPVR
jgi:superfamily II DNA or RNA helicase/diadenosine tetraphosphate (Ap4A) HIT family hydrolase